MAGFQSVVPAVVGGAVDYAKTHQQTAQARVDRAAQMEAARRQRAFEREQQIAQRQAEIQARREEREYQRRLQLEAYQREQAASERELEMQRQLEREAFERELELERERTRRAREIYEAENPPAEADPGLVRERLSTLEAHAEDRATRAQELAAEQASARARAASAGITGGGTAKAIQRNLIDRSRKSGERAETRFQIRLDEQDKRHERNLLDAENRRRRAMLGLETQLQSRA
jgi:colicin import membrane protein